MLFSLHFDDDFALRASCFDVSQGLVGRLERKDAIHHGANGSGIDQER